MHQERIVHRRSVGGAPEEMNVTKTQQSIWLVWADRGSYSDRTEYAVCWFDTKSMAEACARVMQERSNEWRSRISDNWERSLELHEKALAEIGDPQWGHYDETTYSAYELKRGTP